MLFITYVLFAFKKESDKPIDREFIFLSFIGQARIKFQDIKINV